MTNNLNAKGQPRKNVVKKLGYLNNRNKNCLSMEPGAGGALSPMASICDSDTPSSEATTVKEELKNNLQNHLKNMELYKEQSRFAKKHRKIMEDLKYSDKSIGAPHYITIDAGTYTAPYNIAYSSSANPSQADLSYLKNMAAPTLHREPLNNKTI